MARSAKAIHDDISALRTKIYLTENDEERQMYLEEIDVLREELRSVNRKKPVVVPVKDGKTVGDKIEKKLKNKGRRSGGTYGRGRVRI